MVDPINGTHKWRTVPANRVSEAHTVAGGEVADLLVGRVVKTWAVRDADQPGAIVGRFHIGGESITLARNGFNETILGAKNFPELRDAVVEVVLLNDRVWPDSMQ